MSTHQTPHQPPHQPSPSDGQADALHPQLRRLDRLAAHLAADPDVRAVLGLGSAGVEHDRFDDHSDIDFFLVVADEDAKARHLADLRWLEGLGGEVAYHYVNDPNGHKVLLADGLFLELAVFTPAQLAAVPFVGARVVWGAPGFELPPAGPAPAATALDTVGFHLGECLTNLYVGLSRELRGEVLTATRFIQVYAVDRALALVRLHPGTVLSRPDPFEPTRRAEQASTPHPLPLERMVTGYRGNAAAARATLGWLTAHHEADPVIVAEVERLLRACDDRAGARHQSPWKGPKR